MPGRAFGCPAGLHLSAGTVMTHIGHLLAKLRARDRAQLVIVAYETGLVAPASSRYMQQPRLPFLIHQRLSAAA